MIVETTLAIISSIALTILIKRSFCDDNSISYEVMVSLNRFLTNRCVLSHIIYRMTTPKIEPINIEEYMVNNQNIKLWELYLLEALVLRPSGSGKTVLSQNKIFDIYIRTAFYVHIYIYILTIKCGRCFVVASRIIHQ